MSIDVNRIPPDFRMNRREALRGLAMGFGLLGLAALAGSNSVRPGMVSTGPHFAPRAKRVIFLFMNGGPSHVDTFDPKPALLKHQGTQPNGDLFKKSKGTGYMPSPLRFDRRGQSGLEISESLPHIGGVIDDCCLLRSLHTDVPNRECSSCA